MILEGEFGDEEEGWRVRWVEAGSQSEGGLMWKAVKE